MKNRTRFIAPLFAVLCGICSSDSVIAQSYSYGPQPLGGAFGFAQASANASVQSGRGYGRASARASASIGMWSNQPQGGYPAGGMSGPSHSRGQVQTSASGNRRISAVDNGRRISIIENNAGITVSVDGKRVRARDAAALEKKFPDAFRLYETYLGEADAGNIASDARVMLQDDFNKLPDEGTHNLQLRRLIDRMMQNVDRQFAF